VKYRYAAAIVLICLIFSLPGRILAQEPEAKPGQNQELLDRIDALETHLKRLEEESKARKSLEVTEEEKVEKEKEVLQAVGREYSLSPKGTLGVDYSLSYGYSPSETLYTLDEVLQLKRISNHTITHTIATSYSILDNLSTSLNIPVVYRYNKMGTDDELDETDIGDISMGIALQPVKTRAGDFRYTVSLGAVFPTGRSPYKINPDTELSTGSGKYSMSLGGSFSKQVDPVVMFGNLGYSHTFNFNLKDMDYLVSSAYTLQEVDPGDTYSFSLGVAYALSYQTSMNMSFSYSYGKSSTLTYKSLDPVKTGDSTSASMGIGVGFKVNPKTTVSVSVSHSLTSQGFSLTTRVPFDFVL